MKELNVRPNDPNKLIKNLSGGNQQKVLIARWLATHPDLLILDEPTRGIDIGAKAEIQQVVLDLAEQGMGVVFISSEMEEVVRLSDDIEVLKDRHKIAELVNDDTVSQETIVQTTFQEWAIIEPIPIEYKRIYTVIGSCINPFLHHLRIIVQLISPKRNFRLIMSFKARISFFDNLPLSGSFRP